jgi:hypothetical protein
MVAQLSQFAHSLLVLGGEEVLHGLDVGEEGLDLG